MPTRDEKNTFSDIIIKRMNILKIDCLDAIISYCEENELEMEVAATLVNDDLKELLKNKFQNLNYFKNE